MIVQRPSGASQIRKLCEDIEISTNRLINQLQAKSDSMALTPVRSLSTTQPEQSKVNFQRLLEELKSSIIQCLSSSLPQVIAAQQKAQEDLEDCQEEMQQWREKYKKIFALYESNQLQIDKLKIEVISLSQSYENLSVSYEEMKFKYHELKQQQNTKSNQLYLQKMEELNRKVSSHSNSQESFTDRDNIKNENEVMAYQRELFLEEIRQSQRDILGFKGQMEELIKEKKELASAIQALQREKELVQAEKSQLLRQTSEYEHLLEGEKQRSDKLDRQIMELLNNNQDLKLEVLEQKETNNALEGDIVHLREEIELIQAKLKEAQADKLKVTQELGQAKVQVLQLKAENSQEREKNHALQDKERQLKAKLVQSNKQNQGLRTQIEKALNNLQQTTEKLKAKHNQQINELQGQLNLQRAKNAKAQQQSSKQTQEKVQQISRMHRQITSKLQQKINLLQRDKKDKKDKISHLKFQIERLYQSLQQQVQQQHKAAQKIKALTESKQVWEINYKKLEEQMAHIAESTGGQEESINQLRYGLRNKENKLKKLREAQSKLVKITLPKIRQQLQSLKLFCQHTSKTLQLETQQIRFILHSRGEHFTQLLSQSQQQHSLQSQQLNMSFQSQLLKWKQSCKSYQDKYCKLKQANQSLLERQKRLQQQKKKAECESEQKIYQLQNKIDQQQLEHLATLKTIDRLKQKCKEVEQYYRLVQQLERENCKLKQKYNELELYSFRADQHFQHTKPRQHFTADHISKYNKTTHSVKSNPKNTLHDVTAKAEFQRLRMEAVKREYEVAQQDQY